MRIFHTYIYAYLHGKFSPHPQALLLHFRYSSSRSQQIRCSSCVRYLSSLVNSGSIPHTSLSRTFRLIHIDPIHYRSCFLASRGASAPFLITRGVKLSPQGLRFGKMTEKTYGARNVVGIAPCSFPPFCLHRFRNSPSWGSAPNPAHGDNPPENPHLVSEEYRLVSTTHFQSTTPGLREENWLPNSQAAQLFSIVSETNK